jgi:opacity protein-like surface antigen
MCDEEETYMNWTSNRRKMKFLGGALAFILLTAAFQPLGAEVAGPYSLGFNLNFPVGAGDTSDVLKNGFGFGADFTYRKETSPLGIRIDSVYSNFELTSSVLNQINRADTGFATIWGFDASAVLTPPSAHKVRPYLQAGPGFYYEHAEASRFEGNGGVVCDPWFGCWPVSNTQTVQDWSTWRLGWMGGAGLNIEFDNGGALFLQAQYHVINNTNQNTEFVPIAIGYRQSF